MLKSIMRKMFIKNLKKLRKAQGLTQATLAERLVVNRKAVGAWEEHRSFPCIEILMTIAELFQVNLKDMLTKEL